MTKFNLIFLTSIFIFLFTSNIYAAMGIEISPIVGYEKVEKIKPTAHSKTRLTYGGAVGIGVPLFTIEGTYLQGEDTETFAPGLDPKSVKDKTIRIMVGLKSSLTLSPMIRFNLRAGAHKLHQEETITALDDTVTVEKPKDKISPYAGAGFSFRLFGKFVFNADAKGIFKEGVKKIDWLVTSGFTVRLP